MTIYQNKLMKVLKAAQVPMTMVQLRDLTGAPFHQLDGLVQRGEVTRTWNADGLPFYGLAGRALPHPDAVTGGLANVASHAVHAVTTFTRVATDGFASSLKAYASAAGVWIDAQTHRPLTAAAIQAFGVPVENLELQHAAADLALSDLVDHVNRMAAAAKRKPTANELLAIVAAGGRDRVVLDPQTNLLRVMLRHVGWDITYPAV